MQYPNTSAKRPAELVGEIIDSNYALQLILGFKETFPGEISVISIKSSTIFNSVKGIPNVSGIRFMYGMGSADDPASKVILLIPCNNTSTSLPVPNTIVQPEGYLNNEGERVSLKRTWELLYNHAVHYAQLQPEMKFKKIFRGAFFGIGSLTSLLKIDTEAHSVNYHFGFDENITDTSFQHKAVLNPLHRDGTSYDVYFDVNSPCPPDCYPDEPGAPDPCVVTGAVNGNAPVTENEKELNIFRGFRDDYFLNTPANGPLVEMYYYISPALTEAIANTGRAKEIYQSLYRNQIRQCNRLIENGKYEEAKTLFEQTMERLMKEYL
jgi:hypothetical protein